MHSQLREGLRALLDLPRTEQPQAIRVLCAQLSAARPEEDWNTAFGAASLFEAWTHCELTGGLYAANRQALREHLPEEGWTVLEIGGGDGRLWQGWPSPGVLEVVDPASGVHERLREQLPELLELRSRVHPAEQLGAFEANAVVCSLTLHHVAGRDAEERARHGLEGPGKLEILQQVCQGLRARDGLLVLNEANVFCELELAPGDPVLVDNLVDSYVRRCARGLLAELEAGGDPRLEGIVHLWCLEQIERAQLPVAERDVYELDVPRWERLLERAGFRVERRSCTDRFGLFFQYLCRPA